MVRDICDTTDFVKNSADPPVSYAATLKSQGKTMEQIQKAIRTDAAHTTFEADKCTALNSLFVPNLSEILKHIDADMTAQGKNKVAKPSSEVVKCDLHWFLLAKAMAHKEPALLRNLPQTPSQTFTKVI